ncbi:MAG: hypothetical protein PHH00_01485 [Candidatus Nanoarchaeia archaeon]|nr:hypothetical protein [Candidatus Nanoarchaeia archaeon]
MKYSKVLGYLIVFLFLVVAVQGVSAATLNVGKWTENDGPVFDPSAKAYYPSVVKVSDNDYRMWYGSDSGIGYATSTDGLSWTEIQNPVSGLATKANHPLVEHIGGRYLMWYGVYETALYSINAIRYAESTDGITWTNDQAITGDIISGIAGQWNGGSYGAVDILYNSSATNTGTNPFDYSYAMYFDGTTGGYESIGLGYSSDGKDWRLYGEILPRGGDGKWDSNYATFGTIIKESDGNWYMWYSGGQSVSSDGIGYATSSNGLTWTKSSDNPILHYTDGVSWRNDRTYTPMVLKDGDTYKMWFSGKSGNNYAIGYATSTSPHYPYSTIQAAIDNASEGDTIEVGTGTYNENININKRVSIIGAGSSDAGTVIKSSTGSVISIRNSGLVDDLLTIKSVQLKPTEQSGIEIIGDVKYVKLDDVKVIGRNSITASTAEIGLKIWVGNNLSNSIIANSNFEKLDYGWYFARNPDGTLPNMSSIVKNLEVNNIVIKDNYLKGMYIEKLSDTTFTDIIVDHNGCNELNQSVVSNANGAGIDINLKNDVYANIYFIRANIINNGIRTKEGAGLMIKARGTGSDNVNYGTSTSLTNVQINGGTFTGNERGIRIGEPNKSNAGPTNVVIRNANIYGNAQTYIGTNGSAYGDLVNNVTSQINASYNYWGTNNGSMIATLVNGNVDYDFWMNNPIEITPDTPEVSIDDDNGYVNNSIINFILNAIGNLPDLFALSLNNLDWTSWTIWGHSSQVNVNNFDLTNSSIGGNSNDGEKIIYVNVTSYSGRENSTANHDSVIFDTTTPFLNNVNITGAYFNGTDYIFSPANQDGNYDSITIIMNASELVDWGTIFIYNSSGNKVDRFNAESGLKNNRTKTWDGHFSSSYGNSSLFVPTGIYTINTTITDQAENKITLNAGKILVDNDAPVFSNPGISSEYFRANEDVQLNITVSDNIQLKEVILNLGGTNHTVSSNNSGEFYFTVQKGTYSAGNNITYRWYAKDVVGNANSSSENSFLVVSGPMINSFSPSQSKIAVKANESSIFSVSASDSQSNLLNYSWYVDSQLIQSGENNSFVYNSSALGNFNILVNITDEFGKDATRNWTLAVTDIPIIETFTSPETTNLSAVPNISAVQNFKLATNEGKIDFGSEILDLSNVIDIDNSVKIENGVVAVNTSRYAELNRPARITLTGLSYSTVPKIFYDNGFTINAGEINKECDFCKIINYTDFPTTNGTIIFTVEHFTSFRIGGSGEIYDLNLLTHLDKCKNGVQGNLTMSVKDPDTGDEFGPAEIMGIKVKIKNNADGDKNVAVKAILYNRNRNYAEENAESDYENIDSGEDEVYELEMEIPDDIQDNEGYILFFKTYEEDKESEQCNYEIFGIDVKREEHDVILDKVLVKPESIFSGEYAEISADLSNIGKSDEEVYVEVANDKLGILEKSELFEIKEDKSSAVNLRIKIPEDAEEGNYTLQIKAVFEDGENSESMDIYVGKSKEITEEKIPITTKVLNEVPKSKIGPLEIVNFLLITGLVIILSAIGIVSLRKRKKQEE